ncbi:MAG: tetratricopeptide repeat protein [Planctomycetota bacterium]|jgi:tetratricopeptide (TPR) repeat protein
MNRVGVGILLVLITIGAGAAWAEEGDSGISAAEKAKMHVDAAKKFYNQGKIMEARKHLLKAVKLDAKNFDAYFLLGLTYYREENRGGAMKYLTEAKKINPNHQQVNYYMGKAELDLGHLDKAIVHLRAAHKAKEGLFKESQMQIMIPFDLGVCLVKQGKGKEGAKVLKELAEGGKFEQFGTLKTVLKKVYWEGYMYAGEAFTVQGLYKEADPFLAKAVNNMKQCNEGKMNNQVWTLYLFNKHRVPKEDQGMFKGDTFKNRSKKLQLNRIKGWDFVFHHPECYQLQKNPEGVYKQNSQAACAAVWRIHKTQERVYQVEVRIDIDAWDLKTNLTLGKEKTPVSLSSPKDVVSKRLEMKLEDFEGIMDRKLRIMPPKVRKDKFNRKYRAASYQGVFKKKDNPDYVEYHELWCFVSTEYSYFLSILTKPDIYGKYRKEIEKIKKTIAVVKK